MALAIVYLAKTMKKSAIHPFCYELSEISKLSSHVARPVSYFPEPESQSAALPGSILCFVQRKASSLMHPISKASVRHHHHRYVMVAAIEGSGRVCIDSRSFMLHQGQVQLVFPFQFHSFLEVQPEEICWVFVTFEISSDEMFASLRSSRSRTLGVGEILLLRDLMQCWIEKDRRSLLPLNLGLLLGRLGAMAVMSDGTAAHPAGAAANLLMRVNRYIFANLGHPFGLKDLASAVGQSESHLRARFRSATGTSIGRHIRRLRLQQSCSLLHTTGLTIGEVSERCGFDSLYSFSRTFKTEYGLSPREYRMR